ncbi:MAG TPA: hypothetical protein VNW71_24055 [Thermoanaerobaculia bacterium]|nr:hypothetical protein [Thermoanaerobaculia bacterium]
MDPAPEQLREWTEEFEAAARRPLKTRLRYAYVHTYKPVLDDAPYRSFDTTAEYRAWCAVNLQNGWATAPRFEYTQAEEIRDAFARQGWEVLPRLGAFRDYWAQRASL